MTAGTATMDGMPHPTPGMRAVFAEQLRIVALALRREAAIGGGILFALLVPLALRDEPMNFTRDLSLWFAALGGMAPIAVWRGLADEGRPWTLPIEHRRYALMGVAAGWVWLTVATLALLLWAVAAILLTGGHFGTEGTRMVLSTGAAAASATSGAIDPKDVTTIRWNSPSWLWLVPFTAASVAYLIGSALTLATRRPWRWVGGAALIVLLVMLLDRDGGGLASGLATIATHPLGAETVFAGGAVSRSSSIVLLTTGETVRVWRDLPELGRWAAATILWLALGVVALWLATLRYHERERPPAGARRRARI